MRAEERQHRILSLARSNGGVDVAKLAAELAVAPETVRRDLKLLEQHGLQGERLVTGLMELVACSRGEAIRQIRWAHGDTRGDHQIVDSRSA